jgi:hypothetical protein
MTPDEARDIIVNAVQVTRADIVAAKSFLSNAGPGRVDMQAQLTAWANMVSPGARGEVLLDANDIDSQLSAVSKAIVAQLALCAAAWELIHTGVVFVAGTHAGWEAKVGYRTSGGAAGLNIENRFQMVYPEALLLPPWRDAHSELWSADLYLLRLAPNSLHSGVEQALRMSLECFRRDLYVPALAMLGAASEGAWIEMGNALAKSKPSESQASKTLATINDDRKSIRTKIAEVSALYARADLFRELHDRSGVSHRRVSDIAVWSDLIREARNVLHWNVKPTVPNTYETVATFLMAGSSALLDLHAVRDGV